MADGIPLINFINGIAQMGQGAREGGFSGAIDALANPSGYAQRSRAGSLASEERERMKAIDDLIANGQGVDAMKQLYQARTYLSRVAPEEAVNQLLGDRFKRAKLTLLDPRTVQGLPPEEQGPALTRLSAFLGEGDPESARLAGGTLGALRQGEGSRAANMANAAQTTARTPGEVELLKQQGRSFEENAALNARTPYRGFGYSQSLNSDIPDRREDRQLGAQYDNILKDIASGLDKAGSSMSVTPSLQPLLDRANSIRRQLDPNATMLEFGEQEDPSSVQKDPTKPKIMMAVLREAARPQQQAPPPVDPRTDMNQWPQPGEFPEDSGHMGRRVPTPDETVPADERERARKKANTIFRDLIDSSRKGKVDITHDQLVAQMEDAGENDPHTQDLIIQLLAEEASKEPTPIRPTRERTPRRTYSAPSPSPRPR